MSGGGGAELALFFVIDFPAMLAGTLAAVCCGLLGNFLVLRRMSLTGDAISHAVLPGIVIAFIVLGTRASMPMLLGAAAAGVVTVVLVELIRSGARVDPDASLGVVFSAMFALGVLLIERAGQLRNIDIDADCVLYGELEHIHWLAATGPESLLDPAALAQMPRQVVTLAAVTLVAVVVVVAFFKELRVVCFDPGLATTLGFPARWINLVMLGLVAAATVASFEAVGSILVVAMLVCPAATARTLTDRMSVQLWLSAAIAAVSGAGGYVLAALVPLWMGAEHSLQASGMIAVVAGALLVLGVVFSPSHGVVARAVRMGRLRVRIAREDALARLYRHEERAGAEGAALGGAELVGALEGVVIGRVALRSLIRRGLVERVEGDAFALTGAGREAAVELVRSHRLWEAYLVHEAGQRPDHVHRAAMELEHLTAEGESGRGRLVPESDSRETDPHDRPIPPRPPPAS